MKRMTLSLCMCVCMCTCMQVYVCCMQGSYRKCVIKFKNIQEHLRGKIGLFQEHFQEHSQEHFMYNKKFKHVRYKQQFIEGKQKNNGCCPQNYWSHCVTSKSQQTLHTPFSVISLLSSSFCTTCHYNCIFAYVG